MVILMASRSLAKEETSARNGRLRLMVEKATGIQGGSWVALDRGWLPNDWLPWLVERTYINFKFPNQIEWAKAR